MTAVAVCVPFRARNDHEVRVWSWCRAWWAAHYPAWPVVAADSGHEPFNRSASRNTAVSMLDRVPDVIIFANADTIAGHPGEMAIAVDVAADGGWCLPARYVETSEDWTTCTLAEPPDHPLFDPFTGCDRQLVDAIAGPQIMPFAWFDDVGRWDEGFTSWGWEDKALRDALTVLYAPPTYSGLAVHLWHPRGRAESPAANGANRARWSTLYGRAARQRTPAARVAAMRRIIPSNG